MKLQQNIPALEGKTVIFFDGLCNLCSGVVQFIIKRDKTNKFMFASLQSAIGRELLDNLNITGLSPDSIILYNNERIYTESSAVLKILGALPGMWRILPLLQVIPAFIRNPIYRMVARNRYRWFGKRGECMVPTPALKQKFMND